MLNLIAKATVIHGVKEAWFSKRLGRVIYAIIFATCFVLMFFQLNDLVNAYFNGSVGTKLTNPTTLDYVVVPSFYYCNEMWFPNLRGLSELARSKDGIPKSMIDAKLALHFLTLRQNDTMYPFDKYWLQMKKQDLINGIIMLPEKGRFNEMFRAALRPNRGSDAFYVKTHHEVSNMQEKLMGMSLKNTVMNSLGGSMTLHNRNQTHGIFSNEFGDLTSFNGNYLTLASSYDFVLKLSNTAGKPRHSLDGICWEVSPGPVRQRAKQAIGGKHQHVVTHFGGFGRQFNKLVHLYLTTPGIQEMSSVEKIRDTVVAAVQKALKYAVAFSHMYATYASIAMQDEPLLLFDQKIRIDRYAPRVLVKYWTKTSVLKSRKGWPCRTEWTALDQAHCNQRLAKERRELFCEQYLPASKHFDEIEITKQTCLYDHTGLFKLGESAASKQAIGSRARLPLRINTASRQEMLLNLTTNSVVCPRPCTKTLFQFETTFPTTDVAQKYYQCNAALATLFVPLENIPKLWRGNGSLHVRKFASEKIFQTHFKAFIYSLAVKLIMELWTLDGSKMRAMPCSVVEYERSETNGQISEEYFLYSLSDLAANVGGTMGLWFGVSVLSIVQILYLCCLKKLFKLIGRCRLLRPLTGSAGRQKKASEGGNSQCRKSGRTTGSPSRTDNRVHHI